MLNYRPLRVLLVEDHLSTRAALNIWLVDLGHEVEAVETVEAALNFGRKFTFDLLIADIGLPDGNGRDLMIKLRRNHDFLAVAITANSGAAERELSHRAGFAQHLEKPVDLDALTEILGAAANRLQELE